MPVEQRRFTPFRELARRVARREVSSAELVEACLERIAARDGEVRAWAFVDADGAREQARARDAEPARGPLHGIPVGVKDIIDTAGLPTELGTPIHRGRRPARDAACVARLRAAGAVILGKTVTTEFASFTPAATRNPHDLARTPGGSSSGSAAAIADGMAPLALGSQTVGSTIRPAAFCGVAGLKPTHGALPLDGVLRQSDRLCVVGLMAADVAGVAALWEALSPRAPSPAASAADPPRVALVRTPWWERADGSSRRAVEQAAGALREAGAAVCERELPAVFADVPDALVALVEHDMARTFEPYAADPRLSADLRDLVERGLRVTDAGREAALAVAADAARRLDALWADHDVLLAPAVTGEAPAFEDGTGDVTFCIPWSLVGTPAATVPAATGDHGLPVGVQLVAPRGHETALLRVAELVDA